MTKNSWVVFFILFLIILASESNGDKNTSVSNLNKLFQIALAMEKSFGDEWQAISESISSNNCQRNKLNFGKVLWEGSTDKFELRVHEVAHLGNLAYACIPNFIFNPAAAETFSKQIAHIKNESSYLVLDLRENRGGSIFQMYAYSASLIQKPLKPLVHRLNLRDKDRVETAKEIAWRSEYVDHGLTANEINHSKFIIKEVEAGRDVWSTPTYIAGIEQIQPTENHYEGKIIILVGALTFSAAELMAAMFQDNERALIFGTQTVGDGSGVSCKKMGKIILTLCLPWTVAYRKDGTPLKASGIIPAPDGTQNSMVLTDSTSGWVSPDILYKLKIDDLKSDYSGYKEAILSAFSEPIRTKH